MKKLPLLISYAYHNSISWNQLKTLNIDLLVDSGAFTAFKKGKFVDLSEYEKFLSTLPNNYRYFQLDVIGDAKQTYSNLKKMYSDGFKPIPIFTRGDNEKVLEEYYSLSPLIALGGVQMKSDNSPGYVKWFSRINQNRPVHWLGFLDHDFILKYRPTSADASNWASTFMWGTILLWIRGRWHRISQKTWMKYSKQIETLGFDSSILSDPKAWSNTTIGNGRYAQKITIASYLDYIDQVRFKIGTQIHLVVTGQEQIDLIYSLFTERKNKNAAVYSK